MHHSVGNGLTSAIARARVGTGHATMGARNSPLGADASTEDEVGYPLGFGLIQPMADTDLLSTSSCGQQHLCHTSLQELHQASVVECQLIISSSASEAVVTCLADPPIAEQVTGGLEPLSGPTSKQGEV